MTHDELVKRAARWLKSQRCRIVFTERCTNNCEQPDAIGWKAMGESILCECKVSRADFFRDQHKPHRCLKGWGMGQRRYYFTPIRLLDLSELPEGWGLVECEGRRAVETKKATWRHEHNLTSEIRLLVRHGTPPEMIKRPFKTAV